MKLLFFLFSFLSFAAEHQPLLGDSLSYMPKTYTNILQSQQMYDYLATHMKKNRYGVASFLEKMIQDIQSDKNKLYQSECGTPCKKAQVGSIVGCAAGSPFAWAAGWITKNLCINLAGSIGTIIFLPAVGYYIINNCNDYRRYSYYESAALQWQKHLILENGCGIKTMSLE